MTRYRTRVLAVVPSRLPSQGSSRLRILLPPGAGTEGMAQVAQCGLGKQLAERIWTHHSHLPVYARKAAAWGRAHAANATCCRSVGGSRVLERAPLGMAVLEPDCLRGLLF